MFWLDEICYVEDDFDSGCCHLGKFVQNLDKFFINYKCRIYCDVRKSYCVVRSKEALLQGIIGVERQKDGAGFYLIPWNAEDRRLAEMIDPYNGYTERVTVLDLKNNAPLFLPSPLDSMLENAPQYIYYQLNDLQGKRNDIYVSIANILNSFLGLSKYDKLGFELSLVDNTYITLQDLRTFSTWHSGDYRISKDLLSVIISKKLQNKIEVKEAIRGVTNVVG